MPVPTSGSYTDWDIRNAIIEGGGSIGSSFSFEDLVNAADFSKFHPSFLDGATNKSQIVHDGQFRGYPYEASCPDPIFTFSYNHWAPGSIFYNINISNASGRLYTITGGSAYSHDGNGNALLEIPMGGFGTNVSVQFYGGACGSSAVITQFIPAHFGLPSGIVPDAPIVNSNKPCVVGTENATLIAIAPTGGDIHWNTGELIGSPILVGVGTYYCHAVNSNGRSLPSNVITLGYC
jgi:hypothetical protein